MKKDFIGEKFGRLTVIEEAEKGIRPSGQTYRRVKCKCECGNTIIVDLYELKKGNVKSCKCFRRDFFTKHGHCIGRDDRIYSIWHDIRRRCYNVKRKEYKRYGGRGIVMCDEWKDDFLAFYNWAIENGYNDCLTIDRINNDGNYEPSNCRWVTIKVQANNTSRNKKIIHDGETHNLIEWCEILGLKYSTYKGRKRRGWSIEDALFKPVKSKKKNKCSNIDDNKVDATLICEYLRRKNL